MDQKLRLFEDSDVCTKTKRAVANFKNFEGDR